MTDRIDLALSPIRLMDAYLYDVRLERSIEGPIPEGPTLEAEEGKILRSADEPRAFSVILRARVQLPFNEGRAVASLAIGMTGNFLSEFDVSEDDAFEFAQSSAFVILYPYLRASIGQIWRMTGIVAPPLPTIDVQQMMVKIEATVGEPEDKAHRDVTPKRKAATKRKAKATAK